VIWEKQTFTFGKGIRYLVDEVLLSGLSTAFIVIKLKQYSDASFSREIKDEAHLQLQTIIATQNLNQTVLQPFLYDPLLLPAPGGMLPYKELSRLARHFASGMLPGDLVQRIMNSDASEAHFAHLGSYLRSHAEALQKKDPHFKRLVEVARKWQRELEQRRKQRGTKKTPLGHVPPRNFLGDDSFVDLMAQVCRRAEQSAKSFLSIIEAITCELEIPFTNPNDPGLYQRRIRLKNFLKGIKPSHVATLLGRLQYKNDRLTRLFHSKLHRATRQELLGLLNLIMKLNKEVQQAMQRLSPQQLEPYLIDALLVSKPEFLSEVGLNLAQNELPEALAKKIFDGDPKMAIATYTGIGEDLQRIAQQKQDAAFLQRVQQERERREQERQQRQQQRQQQRTPGRQRPLPT
jgi:hypothetical protein